MSIELFHATNDGGDSAAARQFIVAHGIAERIVFRNVFYEEVRRDFTARGGTHTPAIWNGAALTQGRDAVLAQLAKIV